MTSNFVFTFLFEIQIFFSHNFVFNFTGVCITSVIFLQWHNAFAFFFSTSLNTLKANFAWYKDNGISIREKKRGGRHTKNKRYLTHNDILRVVNFISNYADANCIILPGRHPGHKRFDVKLLPSQIAKSEVHRMYQAAMTEAGQRAIKISAFRQLWKQLLPHIVPTKPMTCQKNNYSVYRSSNLPECVKSAKLKKQELHLVSASKARGFYNELIADAKVVVEETSALPCFVIAFQNALQL
jgi:hypothetical protein